MAKLKVLTAGKIKDGEYPIYADGEQVAVAIEHMGFTRSYWEVHSKEGRTLTVLHKDSEAKVLKALGEYILGEVENLRQAQERENELCQAMSDVKGKGYDYAVQVMKEAQDKENEKIHNLVSELEGFVYAENLLEGTIIKD